MAGESGTNLHVSPAAIGKAFADLHEGLRTAEVEFSTVSNNNVIILHSPETSRELLQELITTFTEVHPSRFFVVCLDPKASEIDAYVSAVCQSLGQQKVCSEIVKVSFPPNALSRFPSILRAYLISGRTTEVFIADDRAALELFPTVVQAADYVFFDSRAFKGGLQTVRRITDIFPKVVDLEWLRLSPWRSATRNIFERSSVLSHLEQLVSVDIEYGEVSPANAPASVVLLVSWIISRLKFKIKSAHSGSVLAVGQSNRELKVNMKHSQLDKPGITKMTFRFDACKEFSSIQMSVDQGIVTILNTVPPLRTTRPLEEDCSEELIKKFYLIGESVTNFGPSLKIALDILDAQRV